MTIQKTIRPRGITVAATKGVERDLVEREDNIAITREEVEVVAEAAMPLND